MNLREALSKYVEIDRAARRREQKRRYRQARIDRLKADPTLPVEHGSNSTYVNWGCKCSACVKAHQIEGALYQSRGASRGTPA
jgi:hypothetical protein